MVAPRFQAIVVTRLFFDTTAWVPVLSNRKQPVPYVFFARPGERHACPNSAACWSPAMPAIGTLTPSSSVCAHTPDESTTRGSTARDVEQRQQLVVPVAAPDV